MYEEYFYNINIIYIMFQITFDIFRERKIPVFFGVIKSALSLHNNDFDDI